MFTIHVDTVYDLRLAVLPLATLCDEADIKCSREKLSIIVVSSPYPFVASLRMLPTFFTTFQLHPDGDNFEEHRYKFLLQLFATNISNMYSEDLSMTIYIGGNQRLAPLKFEDPHTGYLQYSALVLSHAQNIDISPIDFGVFVAIRSTEFINIVSDLVILPDELVSITLTETEVKFGALTGEVTFTTENKDCIIGGVKGGKVFYFIITLHPVYFFFHISYTSKFVWIFKTVSSRNLLSCCTGLHASYLVCY
ncbi:uncharacterized protein LOC111499310 isoform X1 [Cucurbita maxima]|uniref:Uncharacterized protein LOC111499310 isoform X1 n=1 Tax=Cucurbita maxima TaxID=3661 RepID=A0A6J1L5J0_CUCMA|nr:uncharacterized protein LOC111499310 isoform X1 [Cucurbita maxima]